MIEKNETLPGCPSEPALNKFLISGAVRLRLSVKHSTTTLAATNRRHWEKSIF